jgi:hypothetical protein
MLEIRKSAVSLDESELLELERVITDGEAEAALKFLNKVIYQKIARSQRAKLSSHLDGGGDTVQRFKQGK